MPTFAKLLSSVFFAALGWLTAQTFNGHLPDNVTLPSMALAMAGLGLVIGWLSMGGSAGKGYRESMAYGVRTSVLVAFTALLGLGIIMMLRKSVHQMYRGDPFAAVLDVPNLMYQYGRYMLFQDVLITLALGGIIGGILAEFAARRWS